MSIRYFCINALSVLYDRIPRLLDCVFGFCWISRMYCSHSCSGSLSSILMNIIEPGKCINKRWAFLWSRRIYDSYPPIIRMSSISSWITLGGCKKNTFRPKKSFCCSMFFSIQASQKKWKRPKSGSAGSAYLSTWAKCSGRRLLFVFYNLD